MFRTNSLWAATAPEFQPLPPLAGKVQTDVLVVGAGFTGLSTALHLAESGVTCHLVEAAQPGEGGSGRNGGQVIPGLKEDPDDLDRHYGAATTEFAATTADVTFDLIARHGIDCDAVRDGWIQAGVSAKHLPVLERRARQWQARGIEAVILDAKGIEDRTGSRFFRGGWFDPRAGRLHPLKYVRGLARAAQQAGAVIHGDSPVTALTRNGTGWIARTPQGEVAAQRIVLATNAYTPKSLWPGLRQTIVPANSFQVATEPLPADLLAQIMPAGGAVSDIRRIGNYFRIGPENRLMMGGRGGFPEPKSPRDFDEVAAAIARIFPQAAGLPIAHRWGGRVGMSTDHMPHLHELAPGLLAVIGYNGRGVALGSAMGRAIAAHLAQGTPLPLPPTGLKPLPLHDLHPVYAGAAIWLYRMRDRFEA